MNFKPNLFLFLILSAVVDGPVPCCETARLENEKRRYLVDNGVR